MTIRSYFDLGYEEKFSTKLYGWKCLVEEGYVYPMSYVMIVMASMITHIQ